MILGVPDESEALDGATSNSEKINKIWTTLGVQEVCVSDRRLGVRGGDGNRKRPILITMTTKIVKENVLSRSNTLKTTGEIFNRIYIKKDIHPSVRAEWKRLREKESAENSGCQIRLDTRERKLYCDNDVIDTWNPVYF